MNIENVRELAKILTECGLTHIEVSDGNSRIALDKFMMPGHIPAVSDYRPNAVNFNSSDEDHTHTAVSAGLIEVKSPIVGVFYAAPAPDALPYVNIGSKVSKGDVLCIIEAMKLLNEITAEHDGEIVDICVKNGDIAEFGQVLFKMS